MKNTKKQTERNRALQEGQVGKLIVKPISYRIKQYRTECQMQHTEILNKLQEVNDSVDIIARHLMRKEADRAKPSSAPTP